MAKKQSETGRQGRFFHVIVALAVCALLVVLYSSRGGLGRLLPGGKASGGKVDQSSLVVEISQMLQALPVAPVISARDGEHVEVRLPQRVDVLQGYQRLLQELQQRGLQLVDGRARTSGEMTLQYKQKSGAVATITLKRAADRPPVVGKIAIIVDDFGYNVNEVTRAFLDMEVPVTYAIIPGLEHSKSIAEELQGKGKAILVHLPMEPQEGPVEAGEYTLFTNLPPEQIQKRTRRALAAVPHAVGVNNHMGSKATTDSTLVRAALAEVRKADFFFIDSRTSSASVAHSLAATLGVRSMENNAFLDAVDDQARIEARLYDLAELARQKQHAIGIAHPRPNTLAAFKKVIPELQRRGFAFVYVHTLLAP